MLTAFKSFVKKPILPFLGNYLTAIDEYALHSPFVFELVSLYRNKSDFRAIEAKRKELRNSKEIIEFNDFGTGKKRIRKITDITQTDAISKKYGKLLACLAIHTKAKSILELGTSVGLGTAYLAQTGASVISIEGDAAVAQLANSSLNSLNLPNVSVWNKRIEDSLIELNLHRFDLIYIDANHSSDAVFAYYNQFKPLLNQGGAFVIDDIYWSKDMHMAWNKLCTDEQVTLSIDFLRLGVLFFHSNRAKQHFKIRL